MKYVDAGYVVALSGLALYAVTLVARRRRLSAALARRNDPAVRSDAPRGAPVEEPQ